MDLQSSTNRDQMQSMSIVRLTLFEILDLGPSQPANAEVKALAERRLAANP